MAVEIVREVRVAFPDLQAERAVIEDRLRYEESDRRVRCDGLDWGEERESEEGGRGQSNRPS